MIKGKRFVVTGGAGFIGSNIVIELIKNGNEVIVVDDLSTGYIENISKILPKITFVNEDIRDLESQQTRLTLMAPLTSLSPPEIRMSNVLYMQHHLLHTAIH
jgi:nucleoside-diphosphate-sugar epimerase